MKKIFGDAFLRKASKEYLCDKCGRKINKSEYYIYKPNFYNLVPTERECLNCFKQKYPSKIEEISIEIEKLEKRKNEKE